MGFNSGFKGLRAILVCFYSAGSHWAYTADEDVRYCVEDKLKKKLAWEKSSAICS